MSNCAGVCLVDGDFRLEYQVIALEFIPHKLINIEAVCLRPSNQLNREVTFKLLTKKLLPGDRKTDIALSIINSLITDIGLDNRILHKLIVRNNKVFYIITV